MTSVPPGAVETSNPPLTGLVPIAVQGLLTVGLNHIAWMTSYPTSGTWTQGDVIYNSGVTSGHPNGWRCTVSGTPGTWVAMSNL